MAINIPQFNQGDPRWKDLVMKPSANTMGRYGCFIVATSMAIHNYAIYLDPGQLLAKLIAVNGLAPDGQLSYDGLMRAVPEVYFHERGYTTNQPDNSTFKTDIGVAINKIRKLVRLGMPTILAVDNVGHDGLPDHAVLAVDVPSDISQLRIYNPDGGHSELFTQKYGDPLKGIFGWVAIIGSPVSFPDGGYPALGSAVYKLQQAKNGIGVQMNVSQAIDLIVNNPL